MRARVLLVAATAALAACGRGSDAPPEDTAAAPTAATASGRPVDHLAPNELLEGTQVAFGLKLPREARIEHELPTVVYATAPVPLDPMVDYVRTRVRDGSFTKSQYTSTFEHVKVPGRPGHEIAILLHEIPGYGTNVELRDTTPPEVPEYPDEASRWRAAGLAPGGRLLDPRKLE